MVDYGFIDAPKPSISGDRDRSRNNVTNSNGIQTKETIGNHSNNANYSRAGNEVYFETYLPNNFSSWAD